MNAVLILAICAMVAIQAVSGEMKCNAKLLGFACGPKAKEMCKAHIEKMSDECKQKAEAARPEIEPQHEKLCKDYDNKAENEAKACEEIGKLWEAVKTKMGECMPKM